MDPRRSLRSVIDPKVRTVGFNAPVPSSPHRSHSVPIESTTVAALSYAPPPVPDLSPASSLSPVMIPPPRHASMSVQGVTPVVGSYNPSDSLLGTSPSALSPGSRIDGSEFSEDMSMSTFYGKGNIVGEFDSGKVTLSFPGHRGEFMPTKFGGSSLEVMSNLPAMSSLTKVSVVNMPLGVSGNIAAILSDLLAIFLANGNEYLSSVQLFEFMLHESYFHFTS